MATWKADELTDDVQGNGSVELFPARNFAEDVPRKDAAGLVNTIYVPPPLMVATTDAALAVAGYAKSTAVRTVTTNKLKDAGIAARATFMCASPVPLACTRRSG
jgi:hypothetical protein